LRPRDLEPYLIRDAQRIIESIISLVHIHNAQEEDIYEHAAAQFSGALSVARADALSPVGEHRHSAFERALGTAPKGRRTAVWASVLIALAVIGGGAVLSSWRYWPALLYSSSEGFVTASATISAMETTPIRAEISGVVDTINCELGATVQAGQVCATIEARALRETLARSEMAIRRGTDELNKASVEASQAKAILERVAASRPRAQKALATARQAYARAQALVLRADANMQSAEAAAKATRAVLARTQLVSPVTGTVVARAAEIGREIIAGGEPPFLVASDLGVVRVEAHVDADFALRRRLGDPVTFAVDGIPGQQFQGKIIELSQPPEAGSAEKTRLVLMTKNDGRFLLPGTSVMLHLE
jgi:RND family efflux transporter MFP subunit